MKAIRCEIFLVNMPYRCDNSVLIQKGFLYVDRQCQMERCNFSQRASDLEWICSILEHTRMSDPRNTARTNCCREGAEEVILNEFDPNARLEVTKGVGVWRVFRKRIHYRLVWPENLDEWPRSHLAEFLQMKLRKGSPSRLQHYAGFIRRLSVKTMMRIQR